MSSMEKKQFNLLSGLLVTACKLLLVYQLIIDIVLQDYKIIKT